MTNSQPAGRLARPAGRAECRTPWYSRPRCRPATGSARVADRRRAIRPGGGGPVARARLRGNGQAEPGRDLALGDQGGPRGLRARLPAGRPALARLAHIRAVAAARIALEATDSSRAASAFWRCERRIRSRHGVGVRQHLPDAEVHWPDGAHGQDGTPIGWAGECWAIEAEITRRRSPGPRRSCARSSSAPATTAAPRPTSRSPAARPARAGALPVLPGRAAHRAARPRRPRPARRAHRGRDLPPGALL